MADRPLSPHSARFRIEKPLGAAVYQLRKAAREAESLTDQGLAEDLWEHVMLLADLHTDLLLGKYTRRP